MADSLEASNNHSADTSFIVNYLQKKSLNKEDKLCLQTVLVHKYLELQAWDICLNYCYKNVEEAHKIADFYSEAFFTKNIGNTFYHIKKSDKAVEYWQRAVALSVANNILEIEEVCLQNIAAVYMEKAEKYDVAEKYLLRSIEIAKLRKTENSSTARGHYRLLATLYDHTNRFRKSATIYEQLIKEARAAKDTGILIESLIFYATSISYNNKTKLDDAIILCKEALKLAQSHNRLDEKTTVLGLYSTVLYTSGNYKEAYSIVWQMDSLNNIRYETDLSKKISEAEIKFNNYGIKHEKEVALLNAKKQRQLIVLICIGIFIIAASLLFVLFERKKLQHRLALQNQLQQEQKLAEEKIYTEKEKERQRISRDLHDNMGAYTTALLSNLHQLKNENVSPEIIAKMQSNAQQILNSLRETIWVLNSKEVSVSDLSDIFKNYCFKLLQSFDGISFETKEEIINNQLIPSTTAIHLYKILQESFQNIIKHAEATSIICTIKSDKKIELSITDNGKGFNTNNKTQGNGIENMQWRAKEIGYSIEIDSTTNTGTTILVKEI